VDDFDGKNLIIGGSTGFKEIDSDIILTQMFNECTKLAKIWHTFVFFVNFVTYIRCKSER
jgi:hypothetical protein